MPPKTQTHIDEFCYAIFLLKLKTWIFLNNECNDNVDTKHYDIQLAISAASLA